MNQALQELAAHGAPMPFKGLSIVTAAVGMGKEGDEGAGRAGGDGGAGGIVYLGRALIKEGNVGLRIDFAGGDPGPGGVGGPGGPSGAGGEGGHGSFSCSGGRAGPSGPAGNYQERGSLGGREMEDR